MKEDLDGYTGGPAVPAFQIELKMVKPQPLKQKVGFCGVTPDNSYIMLRRDPREQGKSMCSVKWGFLFGCESIRGHICRKQTIIYKYNYTIQKRDCVKKQQGVVTQLRQTEHNDTISVAF